MRAFLLVALVGCSPLYRATTGNCPTTATLAADFVISAAGLGFAVDRYNAGNPAVSFASFGAGMAVALAANVSECRR